MAEEQGPRSNAAWRRVRRVVALLAIAFVVQFLVLPQLADAREALDLLGGVRAGWLVAGVVLEAAAIAAYAQLTRTLLPAGSRPPFKRLLAITMSTLGLSHVVPGGSAVGSSLGYRLLGNEGVRGTDAAFAIATQGVGSAIVLNIILWVGLVVSIPSRGFDPLYGTAALLGALLLGAVGGAVVLLTKGEERVAALVCGAADHLPFLHGPDVAAVLGRVATRLRELAADPGLLARATGWATLNWLLDAAALWVFLAAFGYHARLDGLVISYGLANVVAALPITPGGLGVVEGMLTATLVGFGSPRDLALLGVVAYRLVNFWLPIPLGAVSYLSLRVAGGDRRASREVLREAAEEAEQLRVARRRVGYRSAMTDERTERPDTDDDVDLPDDAGVAGAPEGEPGGLGKGPAPQGE